MYATIQDWLKTDPDEKKIQKVLNMINKMSQTERRKELLKKQKELEELTKEINKLENDIASVEEKPRKSGRKKTE